MDKGEAIRALRKEFGKVDALVFFRIVQTEWGKGMLRLRKKLAAANEAAIRKEAEYEEKLHQLVEQIRMSEIHAHLQISIPSGVDPGHLQALIVYGFLMPGRKEVFLESHAGPFERFQQAVKAKLGDDFSQEHFTQAWAVLLANGLLLTHRKGSGTGYSLGLKPNHHGVTPWGKAVIAAIREFLLQWKK